MGQKEKTAMSFGRMRMKVLLMLSMICLAALPSAPHLKRFINFKGKGLMLSMMCFAAMASATHLEPFIDLQEKGLTLAGDGEGLMGWGGGPRDLTVTVGGPVRFALLYWAGRERPCVETPAPGSGDCSGVAQPFKDQELVFDGASITGTIIEIGSASCRERV